MRDAVCLQFLGPVRAENEGQPLSGLSPGKSLALISHRHPLSCAHLSDLSWQDLPAHRGHANLSWTFHKLSTVLPGCLRADRHTVQFHSPIQPAAHTERDAHA